MHFPIVYINGWPGVGKHTIAKALQSKLGDTARLVHNHQHIDLAGAILPRSSPDYQALRHELRAVLFRFLINSQDTYEKIYILTDFQSTSENGASVVQEFAAAAAARGSTFISVVLSCDLEENLTRMTSASRVELVEKHKKGMLLDTEMLIEMRSRENVHRFGVPDELILDVSRMSSEKAAEVIYHHVATVMSADSQVR